MHRSLSLSPSVHLGLLPAGLGSNGKRYSDTVDPAAGVKGMTPSSNRPI